MTTDNFLEIRLNGEIHQLPVGVNIATMLVELGIDPEKVAVERNREIVPRSTLTAVEVRNGDAFEIVQFVGGG